ncbi:hypothetical protein BX600DRAFT_462458 [Xylariales sp. PMI_506]|nr:hypothetical protein BX600DRAFT_462458 [Xylariales sp. PMI_506]
MPESSFAQEPARLETLQLDVLLIIFGHLNTAQCLANLAATCRSLHNVIESRGWCTFVRSHFASLPLPKGIPDEDWKVWARAFTWQSWCWDRRAFSVTLLSPSDKRQQRGGAHARRRYRAQTTPCHVIVDAGVDHIGASQEETVVWGAGEDIVARIRRSGHIQPGSEEEWFSLQGSSLGFLSGRDDITSLSILNNLDQPGLLSGVLAGRASGDLRLLSLDPSSFGWTEAVFMPASMDNSDDGVHQTEVQAFVVDSSRTTLATISRDNLLLYPLHNPSDKAEEDDPEADEHHTPVITAAEVIKVKELPRSRPFKFMRTIKFMDNGDLAVGLAGSSQPLRYLTATPTGVELIAAAKMQVSDRCPEPYILDDRDLGTVGHIMPIDAASIIGGHGNVVLSSWGSTIRLQDLRSPSAIDTVYQDHFEPMNPTGPLMAYGAERFIAGSAVASILKIYDFRWSRGYLYTDALACGITPLPPTPRPPTVVPFPPVPSRNRCDNLRGLLCGRHALSRIDLYRPNCNVYLTPQAASPIYSLARSSELSPLVYAGLGGELVQMSLGSDGGGEVVKNHSEWGSHRAAGPGYASQRVAISIIETGDGIALADISKSQRVPAIRTQAYNPAAAKKEPALHRLDSLLMQPQEF